MKSEIVDRQPENPPGSRSPLCGLIRWDSRRLSELRENSECLVRLYALEIEKAPQLNVKIDTISELL